MLNLENLLSPVISFILEIELTNKKSKVMVFTGKAYVDNNLVAEGEFMAGIVDRESSSKE